MLKPWLTKPMLVLLFGAVAFGSAQSMLRPLVAPYAVTLGAGPLLAGFAVSLLALPGFFLAVPMGSIADRFGRRLLLLAGAVVLGVGGIVLTIVASLTGLFVGQLIIGLGVLALGVGLQAAASMPADGATVDVRRVSGFSTLLMVGHMTGPVLGGVLTDWGGHATAFAGLVVIAVGVGLVALWLPRGEGSSAGAAERGEKTGARANATNLFASYPQARALARERGVLAVVVASSLGVGLLQVRSAFVPLHLDAVGWSASAIGLALSGAGLAGLVARAFFPWLDRRFSSQGLMTVSLVIGAASLSGAVLTTSTEVVFVSLAVSGFALSPTNPLTLVMMSRLISVDRRGLGVGLRLTLNRFSNWVAPVALGGVAALAGIQASLVACSLAAAAAGAAVGRRLPGAARGPEV